MVETKTEERKKLEPTVTREEVGPCKVKLTISVPEPKVRELIDGQYQELNDSVALPGFRRGHAPRKLMERKFGKKVLDDLKVTLLTDSFDEAKEQVKIEPVGEPDLDVETISVKEGEPFSYTVTVEVMPEIEVKDYAGLELEKPPIEVKKEDIEGAIDTLREQRAEWTPIEGKEKAAIGDQVIGDFTLLDGDQTVDTSENVQLELTPNILLYNQKLSDFHTSVEGKQAGDAVEVKVTLPDNHPTHAGKACSLKVGLKSVKRKRLPPVDEKFLKSMDVDDEEELHELVGKQVRRSKETQQREAMKDQIMEKLIAANAFILPEALQKEAEHRMAERLRANYMMHGVPEERLKKELEEQGAKVRELGIKALRGQMILESIAARERIFVTEGMLEEKIGQMAQAYGMRPDEMRAYLDQEGMIATMRREYRAELVRDFLLEKARIAEPAAQP